MFEQHPPWLTRGPRPIIALERLPFDERIEGEEGALARAAATPPVVHGNVTIRGIEPAELVEFDALPEVQKYVDVWPRWNNKQWTILELPDDRVLHTWDGGKARLYQRPPCYMLARYGTRALDGLFARSPFDAFDDRMIISALRVDSPRAALVCARVLVRRKPWRLRARAWLTAHAETAAIGLIPVVFGPPGRTRRSAERALRYVSTVSPDAVRAVATRHGPAARGGRRASRIR